MIATSEGYVRRLTFDAVSKPTPVACAIPLPPERNGEEGDMPLHIAAGQCWVWARIACVQDDTGRRSRQTAVISGQLWS